MGPLGRLADQVSPRFSIEPAAGPPCRRFFYAFRPVPKKVVAGRNTSGHDNLGSVAHDFHACVAHYFMPLMTQFPFRFGAMSHPVRRHSLKPCQARPCGGHPRLVTRNTRSKSGQKKRPLKGPFDPSLRNTQPVAPDALISAILVSDRCSTSRNTSSVCSPSKGERFTSAGLSDSLIGLPTDRYLPRVG